MNILRKEWPSTLRNTVCFKQGMEYGATAVNGNRAKAQTAMHIMCLLRVLSQHLCGRGAGFYVELLGNIAHLTTFLTITTNNFPQDAQPPGFEALLLLSFEWDFSWLYIRTKYGEYTTVCLLSSSILSLGVFHSCQPQHPEAIHLLSHRVFGWKETLSLMLFSD